MLKLKIYFPRLLTLFDKSHAIFGARFLDEFWFLGSKNFTLLFFGGKHSKLLYWFLINFWKSHWFCRSASVYDKRRKPAKNGNQQNPFHSFLNYGFYPGSSTSQSKIFKTQEKIPSRKLKVGKISIYWVIRDSVFLIYKAIGTFSIFKHPYFPEKNIY